MCQHDSWERGSSTYDNGRDSVENDVLEPGVDVVQDEEREECRRVERAGLDYEDHQRS